MKKIILVIFYTILVLSCSNDDSIDIIIGKWKQSQIFENNIEIEFDPCFENHITEYKRNGIVNSFLEPGTIQPDNCHFDFVLTYWKNKGNGLYEINNDFGDLKIYKAYKQGENLVIEYENKGIKTIYEPYIEIK